MQLIPKAIQAGTAVGIGLITALAGSTEIHLVKTGEYTIVDIGKITSEVIVSMSGLIIIAVALYYHIRGAFCIALIFNTIVWWIYDESWPSSIAEIPQIDLAHTFANNSEFLTRALLVFELIFLCLLTLSGLVRSMSDLSGLTREDGSTPRNRWLFIMCGLMTIMSGFFKGPPILISPESAGGIKAGAKTGLSTCVCGLLFCLSTFFSPVMSEVPAAATAPLLIAVGVVLTQNVKKVDWGDIQQAFPAFCCVFFIPFTYNILFGVAVGYIMHVSIGLLTGYFNEDIRAFYKYLNSKDNSSSISDSNERASHIAVMDAVDNNVNLYSDAFYGDNNPNKERV